MKTGRQFSADISAWAKANSDRMDALARQTSQEASARVVNRTPVDTGFLRSSWQPSLGKPQAADGKGNPAGDIGLTVSNMKAGDTFWMTNNAKYARFVEFGTSKMKGRFFVTDTVSQWKNIVSAVAKRLGAK
jgi:HK97 gp10 family phage protein